jgi:hypothetical protein
MVSLLSCFLTHRPAFLTRIFSSPRDPRFIREFKSKYCIEVFAENVTTKKK